MIWCCRERARFECLEIEAATGRHDIWFDSATKPKVGEPLRQQIDSSEGVIHPFVVDDQLVGVITIGRNGDKGLFNAGHVNTVHTFAQFLAIQLINNRFKEETIRSERSRRELEIASEIQSSLLPERLPERDDLEFSAFYRSAQSVGGDFYDVISIGESGMLLVMADVMGKGVPAALFAVVLRTLVRTLAPSCHEPKVLVDQLNRALFEDLSRVEMFVTAQLVFVDLDNHELKVASAGHCPLILWNGKDKALEEVLTEGVPIGVLEEFEFDQAEREWQEGSGVLMYTDGVVEAKDDSDNLLGSEHLLEWLKRRDLAHEGLSDLNVALLEMIESYQGDAAQADDLTYLLMRSR